MGKLTCYSFHSVKGGVGKSSLSTFLATSLAQNDPSHPVYLIDMDLTGTSLADVLPLEAPDLGQGESFNLRAKPLGFLPLKDPDNKERDTTFKRMKAREDADREDADTDEACEVPFLNDFFLYADGKWDSSSDVSPESLGWQVKGGPTKLRIIPSSALPRDLDAILPLIFDEENVAFLEGRLEFLLEGILNQDTNASIVFDTPPTIPGLSRAVLSLALRLTKDPKEALAKEDGFIPESLAAAEISWQAFMVTTMDRQDIRALNRWLNLIEPEDEKQITVLINKVTHADPQQIRDILNDILERPTPKIGSSGMRRNAPKPLLDAGKVLSPLWDNNRLIRIPNDPGLNFFQGENMPEVNSYILSLLLKGG